MVNDLRLKQTLEHGHDSGRGNLLGVQPFMSAADYTMPASFLAKLQGYLEVAAGRGWLNEQTIVVYPEHIGTWLAGIGGGEAVAGARTVAAAMRPLILRQPWPFIRTFLRAGEGDRAAASFFRLRAAAMLPVYESTFARLARAYGVTIVAGSIVLPEPRVDQGRLAIGAGALYNTSAVFARDGHLHPQLARKVYLLPSEQPFVTAAAVADLPAFDTPVGRLGVLVCADAWYPDPYARLREQGVEIVAVPSYVEVAGLWWKPWGGYSGGRAPADVDLNDVGVLSEGEAWRRYALAGRFGATGARAGINVFLRGDLWDLGGDSGDSLAVVDETVVETKSAGAALLNVWL